MILFGKQFHIVTIVFILSQTILLLYLIINLLCKPKEIKRIWVITLPIISILCNLFDGLKVYNDLQLTINLLFLLVNILLTFKFSIIRISTKNDDLNRDISSVDIKNDLFKENCSKYNLTEREIEVVLLLRSGHSYREIANTLFISTSTVDSHIQNIFAKVGERKKIALLNKLER